MSHARAFLCISCHTPRTEFLETPGERKYTPCQKCGAVGILEAQRFEPQPKPASKPPRKRGR